MKLDRQSLLDLVQLIIAIAAWITVFWLCA